MRNDVPSAAAVVSRRPVALAHRSRAYTDMLILILCGAALSYALSNALLMPLLPRVEATLRIPAGSAVWIVTALALSAGLTTPVLARWGDGAGRKRALVFALAALAVGSLVCALATSFWPLVVGRVLQGCAGVGLPMYMRIMRDEMPEARRNFGLGLVQASNWLGAGVGGLVAGYVAIHTAGFSSVFWINFAVAATVLGAVLVVVPRSDDGRRVALDLPGALLLAAATASGLIALSEGITWGWASAPTLVLLSVAVVGSACFVAVERTSASPIIDLKVLAIPAAWGPILTAGVGIVGYFGAGIGVATYIQLPLAVGGMAKNPLQAAVLLIPLDCAIFIAAPLVAYLAVRAIRPGYLMVAGPLLMALGTGGLLWENTSMVVIAVLMGVIGFGFGLTFAALTIEGTNGVPKEHVGSIIGVSIVVVNVLITLSGAVLSSCVSAHSVRLESVEVPTRAAFTSFWLFCLICSVVTAGLAATYVVASNRRLPASGPSVDPNESP
ncbi:MFS transporter [Streptomyces lydicus]|uniref:MFS transporter n=1 Tax=Streptomyces lydicus TaxID=47763 RepID=UPI0036E23F3B